MNVRELIEHLEKYRGGLRVVVSGYEDGFDELLPARIEVRQVSRNINRPGYDGEFARAADRPDAETETAVALHRNYDY